MTDKKMQLINKTQTFMLFSNQYYLFGINCMPNTNSDLVPSLDFMAKQYELNPNSLFPIASFLYYFMMLTDNRIQKC